MGGSVVGVYDIQWEVTYISTTMRGLFTTAN